MNHVSIALGSQGEVDTCLEICRRLSLLGEKDYASLMSQTDLVGKLLYGLYRSLENRLQQHPPTSR